MVQWVHFVLLSFCCFDFLLKKLQVRPTIYNFLNIPDSQIFYAVSFGHSNYANFQQKTLPTNASFSAETSSQELHISNNLFEIIDKGTILDSAMSFSRKGF